MRARDNPFSTDRIATIRYRHQHQSWSEFLSRLEQFNYRAAIVGPEGSGKTTLLEDLATRFSNDGGTRVRWLRLSDKQPRFPKRELDHFLAELEPRDLICFDSAERMGRFAWRTRHIRGLIVTSHNAGRLPTWITCTTTPELLEQIVRKLLDGRVSVDRKLIESIHKSHHGNIRDALRALYDLCADDQLPLPVQQQADDTITSAAVGNPATQTAP